MPATAWPLFGISGRHRSIAYVGLRPGPLALDCEARARALELLTALDAPHRVPTMLTLLHGGEQQRVSIARSQLHRPLRIPADWPTTPFDSLRPLLSSAFATP